MCGIIGYTGKKEAKEAALEGLYALEYRGYDSAGVCYTRGDGTCVTVKSVGRISDLEQKLLLHKECPSHTAIGHTRWATHGAPTEENCHPHGTARVRLVHNGIIENYALLKEELVGAGYTFSSETDTEVAAVLIDSFYEGDPVAALIGASSRMRGSFAFAIIFSDRPDTIYAMRVGSPLIVGLGEGENLVASDVSAVLGYTDQIVSLPEACVATVTGNAVTLVGRDGKEIGYQAEKAAWDRHAAERGGYAHFMRKEIAEEPEAVRRTLTPRISGGLPDFSEERVDLERLSSSKRLILVACGTAMHAALLGKRYLKEYAGMEATVEIASEFRYDDATSLSPSDAVIAVSQSGETADTLAALRLAKERGAYTLGVVNAVGSSLAREADGVLYTWAGPEIAVASTKAYVVQATLFFLLAVHLGFLRGLLDQSTLRSLTFTVSHTLPNLIERAIASEGQLARMAVRLVGVEHLFFIGRGADYAAAMEASLKLKEISYIHSEAYAAGEMKHGTISLIDKGTPVVALATQGRVLEKTLSNVKEVKSRGAWVLLVAPETASLPEDSADALIRIPDAPEALMPLLLAPVLQLLAYHAAVVRGCDVDKPRNLAKSVTVE